MTVIMQMPTTLQRRLQDHPSTPNSIESALSLYESVAASRAFQSARTDLVRPLSMFYAKVMPFGKCKYVRDWECKANTNSCSRLPLGSEPMRIRDSPHLGTTSASRAQLCFLWCPSVRPTARGSQRQQRAARSPFARPPASASSLRSYGGKERRERVTRSFGLPSFGVIYPSSVRVRPSVRPFSGATNRRAGDSPPRTPLPRRTPARRRPHFIRVARAREGCGRGTLRDPWLWSPIFSSMSLLQNRQLLHFFCPPMRNKVALEITPHPQICLCSLVVRCPPSPLSSTLPPLTSSPWAKSKHFTLFAPHVPGRKQGAGKRRLSKVAVARWRLPEISIIFYLFKAE